VTRPERRRRGRLSALVIALAGGAVAAAGCSPAGGGRAPAASRDSWQGTIEERNGVAHVRNPDTALWEDAAQPPLRFEPDGAFGGAASALSSIAGAVIDGAGNLHVYDAAAGQLVAFAPDGTVRHRAGAAGRGPGELQDVRGISTDGDATIWLANQGGRRLDAWGTDGTPGRSIDVNELGLTSVYMGGFVAPDRLALLTDAVHHMATNEYVVVDPAEPPSVTARFSIGAEPMVPIPPGMVLQLSHTFAPDRILVGTWEQYVLRAFDAGGTLRRRVTRPVLYLRRPGFALRDQQYVGVALGGLAAPIVLASGHWLVLATWPTNVASPNIFAETPASERPAIEWASSLDLFDAEGRFLYSLQYPGRQMPDIGRPWTVGPDGALYTVNTEPFPQVRRYRVVLQPPVAAGARR
jgi:hypothetical protein